MLPQGDSQLEDPVVLSARKTVEVNVRMEARILTRFWGSLRFVSCRSPVICTSWKPFLTPSHSLKVQLCSPWLFFLMICLGVLYLHSPAFLGRADLKLLEKLLIFR